MYFVELPPQGKGDAIFSAAERVALENAQPGMRIAHIIGVAATAGDTIARITDERVRDIPAIRSIGEGLRDSLGLKGVKETTVFTEYYTMYAGLGMITPAREELIV